MLVLELRLQLCSDTGLLRAGQSSQKAAQVGCAPICPDGLLVLCRAAWVSLILAVHYVGMVQEFSIMSLLLILFIYIF